MLTKKYVFQTLLLIVAASVSTNTISMYSTKRQCEVCISRVSRHQMRQLSCGHSFCQDCLQTIIDQALKETALGQLKCPNFYCKQRIELNDIRNIVGDEETIEQARELLSPKKADTSKQDFSTKVWCFFNTQACPQCEMPIEKNSGCNHMTCRNCTHEFCWVCMKPSRGFDHHCPPMPNRLMLKKMATGVLVGLAAYTLYSYLKRDTRRRPNS